jgi:plasmid stabilization system protein ParE
VKRLEVEISPHVEQQILEHVLYIARDSIDYAIAWERRLRAAIDAIGDLPGHAIDEVASLRAGGAIRKIVFERTYLVFYQIHDSAGAVEIVNFRHGARLPKRGEP